MADDELEVPDGWTEQQVRQFMTKSDQSGTFDGGEELAEVDVPEIQDDDEEQTV